MLEITRLDRVRFAVPDSREAAVSYERLLARSPRSVPSPATSVSFQLDNMALELVPESAASSKFQVVFATEDLAQAKATLGPSAAVETSSADELRLWPESSGGLEVLLCQREQEETRAVIGSPAAAIEALDHLVVRTRDADACRLFYEQDLGLRVVLDRSFEDFLMRLIFCRVGGVTVEIAAALGEKELETDDAWTTRDSIYGFSWRATDIEAAHARMEEAGIEVSPVRKGRRPNTRVFTVRDGTCGVPTLVLGIEAANDQRAESH